jgi:hypothetical protein
MRRITIADAPPRVIDWLVAKVDGAKYEYMQRHGGDYNGWTTGPHYMRYSTNPAQGQPILERERIHLIPLVNPEHGQPWEACTVVPDDRTKPWFHAIGPTMLIAGLRCFLVSRLGEEAEVPEELL